MGSCVIGTIEMTGERTGASEWQSLASPMPPRLMRDGIDTSIEALSVDADALRHDLAALFASYRRQLPQCSPHSPSEEFFTRSVKATLKQRRG